MPDRLIAQSDDQRFRQVALALLLAALAYKCIGLALSQTQVQPLGVDFSPLWAAGRAALHEPTRIFDFAYITSLQGWPLGQQLRPYVYPPTVLLLCAPLALLPLAPAYALWTTASGGLYLAAARLAGAPLALALLPVVWLVAICGQITFAVAGLVLLALTLLTKRPLLAGALLGVAAALKPQLLVLTPVGLAAVGQWRPLLAAFGVVSTLGVASMLAWGFDVWLQWIDAVGDFSRIVIPSIPGLRGDEISVAAWLDLQGLPPSLAFGLIPIAVWIVWAAFRASDDALARASAAFGGALLITPYAMHYEAALLAPGMAAWLVRTRDRMWLAHATVAVVFTVGLLSGPTSVLCGLLPALSAIRDARPKALMARRAEARV